IARTVFLSASLLIASLAARGAELPAGMRAQIDKDVASILAKSGAPGASIAVVRDGALAYEKAYGSADLAKKAPASPSMRYAIGSISKQFLAASVLLLVEEGRLALDDKVVRWFPDLTRANEITLRNLLSMTSGYSDYWPQDYVMPMMLADATPEQIIDAWARRPLDFEPGSKYQYSNTNYVIAARIVEKVSGLPYFAFVQKRIFEPLGMTTVFDTDGVALPEEDASRYHRYALAPVRPAPKEGKGWLFGMGSLAMTARDLATWDRAMIDGKLLTPKSWRALQREMQLVSGTGTQYGLGVGVSMAEGRRRVSHGGEVSGFTATNSVYPDQRAAVVALVNLDATDASSQIASAIGRALFAEADPAAETALAQVKSIFSGLQKGTIDRSLFTDNANFYFSDDALADFRSSLGPLGRPQEIAPAGAKGERGGMTLRRYTVKFPKQTLRITTFIMPDGKFEQFTVAP
ncbi:MAG TPA: serine hydrolase domain-containing protein, partial [Thermoanaerobaculia bacterium]